MIWEQITVGVRTAVLTAFQTAHPGIDLVFENEPYDHNNLPDHFVELEVTFYDGEQVGMSSQPVTRLAGYVYATAYSKNGTGVLKGLRYLQTLAGILQYASISGARLQAPSIEPGPSFKGYDTCSLKVPFYT